MITEIRIQITRFTNGDEITILQIGELQNTVIENKEGIRIIEAGNMEIVWTYRGESGVSIILYR